MNEAHHLLPTLALVLAVAALATVVFQRLRQPVVFGYVLAGLITGSHVPFPAFADERTVRTLSELGVILLMFSLGLDFSLRRLAKGGWPVVIVAVLETSTMFWLGYVGARLAGWTVLASLYAGGAIAIASTTIIIKAFADQGARGRFTELVVGILVVEDLIAVLLLAILTPGSAHPAASAGPTILRLAAVLALFLAIGSLIVPRLVRYVAGLERPEITLITSMGICFGLALVARRIGYSVALGAFIAGSLVAESGEERLVARLVEPVRDMFVAVFFVSVGMMIVPELVVRHWRLVLALLVVLVGGKVVAVSVAAFLTGAGTRTALQTGMSMAQIGEFSFIIAAAGLARDATPPSLYPAVVAVSAITTLTTPWLIRFAGPAAAWLDRRLPRSLQTFAALYGAWIEGLGANPETSADRLRLRRALRGLALDAGVVVALAVGASLSAAPLAAMLSARTGLASLPAHALSVGAAVALSVPFLLGIVRTGRVLGQILSRRAFPEPEPNRLDLAAAPRRALVVAIQLTTVLVVGAPLVAVTQPSLPPIAGFAVVIAGLLALGIVMWRTAADLQGHVRAAAEAIVDAIGRQARRADPAEGERALRRAYQVLPGLAEPVPVRIAESSPVVGLRLARLGLRGRTGATIIAISRGQDVVLVPDGHVLLVAGDVVALAGTHAAIEAARDLLEHGPLG